MKKMRFNTRHLDLILILSLVSLAFFHLLFALRTNLYFSGDDFITLSFISRHNMFSMIKSFFFHGDLYGFRRVLGYVVVKALFDLFQVNPLPYTLVNHILHTLNLLVFFLVIKLLTNKPLVAFFVSIIFNKIYLFYYSNLHEYLLTLFCLLAIYFYLKNPRKIWPSLLCFILGLLIKEMAATLPVLLLAMAMIKKFNKKYLWPFFATLTVYLFYQSSFIFTGRMLPGATSYQLTFSFNAIKSNFLFYFSPSLMVGLLGVLLIGRKIKPIFILLVALLTLTPVFFFKSRLQDYYFYLPFAYILMYLSLLLPKMSLKSLPLFVIIFLLFGGREVLPKIAWQEFPNWQKVSVENVTGLVEESLKDKRGLQEIKIDQVYLERDARTMLEYNVLDLFLPESITSRYSFSYDSQSKTIKAVTR